VQLNIGEQRLTPGEWMGHHQVSGSRWNRSQREQKKDCAAHAFSIHGCHVPSCIVLGFTAWLTLGPHWYGFTIPLCWVMMTGLGSEW
jgi:hypothetical protein